MKHIILFLMLAIAGITYGQTYTSTSNNTFKVETSKSSSYVETPYSVEYKGTTYKVYEHTFTRGARKGEKGYFIQRVSQKTGKTYWFELKNFAATIKQ